MAGDRTLASLSRRQIVKGGVVGGLALSAGGVLTACGSSDAGTAPTGTAGTTTPTGERKRGGTLRVGVSGGGKSALDPTATYAVGADATMPNLFDKLADFDPRTYRPFPNVLEVIEPNAKGDKWTLRVRKGVKFHDGTDATADDLVASFKHMEGKASATAGALALLGLTSVRKVDQLTVTLNLAVPSAIVLDVLASSQAYLLPKDFDPQSGIGTGPFKLKARQPGQETTFEAFADYWGEDGPYLDGLIITEFQDATSKINAFLAGQLDAIDAVPPSQRRIIEANSNSQLVISKNAGWRGVTMCTTSTLFSSVQARQGLRLLIDREQLLKQAYADNGTVANDLYCPNDPLYAKSLPQRVHDPEKGVALLRQAGVADQPMVLRTNAGASGLKELGQVVSQQASAAGLKMTVKVMDPNSFYAGDYLHYPLGTSYWNNYPYLYQVSQVEWGKNSPYNQSQFNDPEFNSLVGKAIKEPDAATRKDFAQQMQRIQYDRGGLVIPSYVDGVDAVTKKVVGIEPDKGGLPLMAYRFKHVSFG